LFTSRLSFVVWSVIHFLGAALILWRVASSPYYFVSAEIEIPKLHSDSAWYWTPFHLAIDFFTWRFVWPHVKTFLLHDLWFRIRFGFQRSEIVFREPKGWPTLQHLPGYQKYDACWGKLGQAINPLFVYERTALYSSVSGFWELNYGATVNAHYRASNRMIPEKNWDFSIWISDGNDWFVWRMWRAYDRETIRRGTLEFRVRSHSFFYLYLISDTDNIVG
jgi:hypothetical protein